MLKKILIGLMLMNVGVASHAISSSDCGRFQGVPINQMLARYGQPDTTYNFPTGEKSFTWSREGYSDNIADVGDVLAFSQNHACRISLTTDRNDAVSTCQYQGRCRTFQNLN